LLPRKKSSLKGNPYDIRHGESTTDQKKRKPENQMSGKSGYGNWYKISAEKYPIFRYIAYQFRATVAYFLNSTS
jgi:hypothetical protein